MYTCFFGYTDRSFFILIINTLNIVKSFKRCNLVSDLLKYTSIYFLFTIYLKLLHIQTLSRPERSGRDITIWHVKIMIKDLYLLILINIHNYIIHFRASYHCFIFVLHFVNYKPICGMQWNVMYVCFVYYRM